MAPLTWDPVGDRTYETGVDRGVLYPAASDGTYPLGVAWNGLTTVTESPSGAESNKQYADNIVYVNLLSAEEFAATVEAFTYPDEFAECDGTAEPQPGVFVGQQHRKSFGLSYRTLVGNDTESTDYGYKIHLVYGAQAAPSEKAYGTVNDSPEAMSLSWEISTTPVYVSGLKSSALLTIDSTKVNSAALTQLETILYGAAGVNPRLPLPAEVIDIFAGGPNTTVDLGISANQPTYNAATHIVTLPTVTGVQWKINGANKAPGAQPALAVGQVAAVEAVAQPTYVLKGDEDWTFDY